MKNLKRALSLTMASTMLVSMMATGANAAIFPDADEIVNDDAVNMLVALNIINGKDDGTFDPTGIVTRGEMAKMICVALNGGKDPNLTGGGLYSDTVGHWASGYIDYCTNLGIVSGFAGNFRPNDTVTGIEAAKMLLIAMGHDAADEGYVNSASWDLNISIGANNKDLYEDLDIAPSAGLSRDDAAQMIFNGISATMVYYGSRATVANGEYVWIPVLQDYSDNRTILTDRYDIVDTDGVMTSMAYDATDDEYSYVIGGVTYTTDTDYSEYFRMSVRVIHETNKTSSVYGVFKNDSEVLFSGLATDITVGEADDETVTLDGSKYNLASGTRTSYDENDDVIYTTYQLTYADVPVYAYNTSVVETLADIEGTQYEISAIDVTGDGKVNVFTYLPYEVVEVVFVGTSDITYKGAADSIVSGTVSVDESTYPEDIAAGDILKLVFGTNTIDGNDVLEVMDTVEGTVTSLTSAGKYRINGVLYTASEDAAKLLEVGEEFLCSVVGTHIFVAELISEGATIENVVYLSAAVKNSGLDDDTYTARIYFLDGTSEVVTLDGVYEADGESDVAITDASGSEFADESKGLYTFKISSGKYTLRALGNYTAEVDGEEVALANDAGFDYVGTGVEVEDGQLDNDFYVADSAVVVAVDGDGDIYFLTGEDVNAWDETFGTTYLALANDVNGLETAEVLYIVGDSIPGLNGTETYGYITSDVEKTTDADGDVIYTFTVWTAEGAMTVYSYDASDAYAIGTTISFELKEDGEVEDVAVVGNVLAVTGYSSSFVRATAVNEDASLSSATTDYVVDSDTVFIYINSANEAGVEGGVLALASQYDLNMYYANIVMVVDAEDGETALAVFVDVNNKIVNVTTAD